MLRTTEILEGLRNQHGILAGIEHQIQALLDSNRQNSENEKMLEGVPNRKLYFLNQHMTFSVLFEAVVDMKCLNCYALLDLESQLREEIFIK